MWCEVHLLVWLEVFSFVTISLLARDEPPFQQPSFRFGDFFTIDKNLFFRKFYQQKTFVDHRASGVNDISHSLYSLTESLLDLNSLCHVFEHQELLRSGFHLKHQGATKQVTSCAQLYNELNNGAGVVIRFEYLRDFPAQKRVLNLQGAVYHIFGTDSTIHLYHVTKNNSRALMPHTDPYDVVVVQLHGSKEWTACVPPAYDREDNYFSLNEAQLGQLQEIRRQNQQGCTAYEDHNLRGMRCRTFTLHEGDTMYMPKGIIHYAISGVQGSSHITISLERAGLSWADALIFVATDDVSIVNHSDFMKYWKRAIQLLISDRAGLSYLEVMPTWSFRPNSVCLSKELYVSKAKENNLHLVKFIKTYLQLCYDTFPMIEKVSRETYSVEPLLQRRVIIEFINRVCSTQAAKAVLKELCKRGRLPVDITAASFHKNVRLKVRERRATQYYGYACYSGCDSNCNTTNCDQGCDTSCDENCDGCNDGCDDDCDNPCTTNCSDSCDSSCDICNYSNCDASCDSYCHCDPGFYGNGSSCEPCPVGTYSSDPNSQFCINCGNCPDGEYRDGCGEDSAGSCRACESCPSGKERTNCTDQYPGSCHSCKIGFYKPTPGPHPCSKCENCSEGFHRSECGGTRLGSCVGITCNTPTLIQHSAVVVDNNGSYPSTATYTCKPGYQLKASSFSTLSCTTHGSWSGTIPKCVNTSLIQEKITHEDSTMKITIISYEEIASGEERTLNGFDGQDLLIRIDGIDLETCKSECNMRSECAGLFHLTNRQDNIICRILTQISMDTTISPGIDGISLRKIVKVSAASPFVSTSSLMTMTTSSTSSTSNSTMSTETSLTTTSSAAITSDSVAMFTYKEIASGEERTLNGFDGQDLLIRIDGIDLETCKSECNMRSECAGLFHLTNRQDNIICRILTQISMDTTISPGIDGISLKKIVQTSNEIYSNTTSFLQTITSSTLSTKSTSTFSMTTASTTVLSTQGSLTPATSNDMPKTLTNHSTKSTDISSTIETNITSDTITTSTMTTTSSITTASVVEDTFKSSSRDNYWRIGVGAAGGFLLFLCLVLFVITRYRKFMSKQSFETKEEKTIFQRSIRSFSNYMYKSSPVQDYQYQNAADYYITTTDIVYLDKLEPVVSIVEEETRNYTKPDRFPDDNIYEDSSQNSPMSSKERGHAMQETACDDDSGTIVNENTPNCHIYGFGFSDENIDAHDEIES